MKAIRSLIAILALISFAGCASSPHRDYSGIPPAKVVVTITCNDPGMKFFGTITSDGRAKRWSGAGQGTFRATGHELKCSFEKEAKAGRISISVSEGGNVVGTSSTSSTSGVYAELVHTIKEQHSIFTTF
jgi:hypothetical protein